MQKDRVLVLDQSSGDQMLTIQRHSDEFGLLAFQNIADSAEWIRHLLAPQKPKSQFSR